VVPSAWTEPLQRVVVARLKVVATDALVQWGGEFQARPCQQPVLEIEKHGKKTLLNLTL
jgi:hypothetical protein